MSERPTSRGPESIGRYRILQHLGSGGMGEVLLAVAPDGRLVAIKRIHVHLVEAGDFLSRFRREVHASSKVGPRRLGGNDSEVS
jgi:serine/threonine protein kinase